MTDTLFRESFAEYVKGVDLLYHESTYGNEFADLAKETFHSTAGQAARMAVLAGVKHLLLGHFSSRYPDPSPRGFPEHGFVLRWGNIRTTCREEGVSFTSTASCSRHLPIHAFAEWQSDLAL